MRDFHIGDRLTYRGRAFSVRGFSPMSVTRRTLHLEDEQTGEWLEVPVADLVGEGPQASTRATELGVEERR